MVGCESENGHPKDMMCFDGNCCLIFLLKEKRKRHVVKRDLTLCSKLSNHFRCNNCHNRKDMTCFDGNRHLIQRKEQKEEDMCWKGIGLNVQNLLKFANHFICNNQHNRGT